MSNILSESEEKILRTLRQDLNLVGFANSLEQQFVNPKNFMELTFITTFPIRIDYTRIGKFLLSHNGS